ncbi:MAG: hypothetical protein FWG22_01005 [Prolixibacteraceae bacterium]|nr:hypothetical protein [Prolixibacteraceae bacterium]
MKNRKYPEAFEKYDKAMKNLGDVKVEPAINFNIGYAAMQAGKNEEALVYLDKAIEADANVSKSWEYKAAIYNKTEDYKSALASFEKAIEKAIETSDGENIPENIPALVFNAGIVAFRLNEYQKTIDFFDKAIEVEFKAEDAYMRKAAAQKKMGDDEAYKNTLITANEKIPEDKKIAAALSNIYVGEANGIYKTTVDALNAANKKVNDGVWTLEDDAYKKEIAKTKTEFKKAVDLLGNAAKLDDTNENAKKLLEVCKGLL